jgi:hypothetical protein
MNAKTETKAELRFKAVARELILACNRNPEALLVLLLRHGVGPVRLERAAASLCQECAAFPCGCGPGEAPIRKAAAPTPAFVTVASARGGGHQSAPPVCSWANAVAVVQAYQAWIDLGQSDCGPCHGYVYDVAGVLLGRVSYNGRCWSTGSVEIFP